MKNSKNDSKMPNIVCLEEMADNELMLFDIKTGSSVLLRDGEIIAVKTLSTEEIKTFLAQNNVPEKSKPI